MKRKRTALGIKKEQRRKLEITRVTEDNAEKKMKQSEMLTATLTEPDRLCEHLVSPRGSAAQRETDLAALSPRKVHSIVS